MTSELTAFYDRTLAAERSGDAAEALEYYNGIPMFRRSRHRALLEQLAASYDELPPWVWARWIVYQAIRCEGRSRTGALLQAAMHHAVESFHADLMDTAYDVGGDPVKVLATVMGESWVCHQLAAHEYGALGTFLDEFVDGALAEHAELARARGPGQS
jgi:hypothetical protein